MPRQRVLMIAHHFPPAGGSGSNRALAFARYLPEYGWEPIVITLAEDWASNRDDDLLAQLPPNLRVIRTRSLESKPSRQDPPLLSRSFLAAYPLQGRGGTGSSLDRMKGSPSPRARGTGDIAFEGVVETPSPRARGTGHIAFEGVVETPSPRARGEGRGEGYARPPNSLRAHIGHLKRFPDAHLGWLPFALAAARRQDYDVAYSSSGPFTSHLIGLILKRSTKRPWVAELRDGWYRWNRAIFPDYPAWRDVLERRLEAAALRAADKVVLVTDRMADAFAVQYPDIPRDRFAVVSNGFDPVQFTASVSVEPSRGWEVLHAGALYYGRSLAAFLEAARRLIEADADFARHFRLTLLGTLDPRASSELRRSGLEAHVNAGAQVNHAAALAAMYAAGALLLVANTTPGAEATVPG
jgi:glycosyltransferase involved in cell wall biosynthesis